MTAHIVVVYLDLATCKRTLLLSAWSMLDGVSMAVRSSHSSRLPTSILWTDGRTDGSPDDRRRGERRVTEIAGRSPTDDAHCASSSR